MQHHTGQYRYQCNECGKGFNEKTHFEYHMRGHDGITFRCKQCSKCFTLKTSLQKHLLSHM